MLGPKGVEYLVETDLATRHGQFRIRLYSASAGADPHIVVVARDSERSSNLVRIQSECITGTTFDSVACDCGEQLSQSLERVGKEGGAVIYLRQEGRGIGLQAKLQSYVLQRQGMDTVDANVALGYEPDPRTYDDAVSILENLSLTDVRLLTNNPKKSRGLSACGINVVETIGLIPSVHQKNFDYLRTKVSRMGHNIVLPERKVEE